jgi:hypothetical protein
VGGRGREIGRRGFRERECECERCREKEREGDGQGVFEREREREMNGGRGRKGGYIEVNKERGEEWRRERK